MSKAKKLIIVLVTFLLVTEASMEDTLWPLERVLYIHHTLRLQKELPETKTLINSNNEVNTMSPVYVAKLGLKVWKTDIGV